MLPTFTATESLAMYVSNQGVRLSDAYRFLARHGIPVADERDLHTRVLALLDSATLILNLADGEPTR